MEEITVNNILLAEFLGWGFNVDSGMFKVPHLNEEFNMDSLQFHSDWNWLMVVVEKIETMDIQPEFFVMYDKREDFKGWYWSISVSKLFYKGCLNRETSRIIAVYNACIQFVKWYNNENK